MTPEQLKKKPFEQIIKIDNEKLDTDEWESTKDEEEYITSTELSEEDSAPDTIADDAKDSKST